MRRTFKNTKADLLKKKILKQAKELRAKLETEHGEVFAKIKQHAQRKHAEAIDDQPVAAPSAKIEIKEIPIDRKKNMKTVLKFMEERNEDGVGDDAFAKKVFDLLQRPN